MKKLKMKMKKNLIEEKEEKKNSYELIKLK
jgi:hypothetical protein